MSIQLKGKIEDKQISQPITSKAGNRTFQTITYTIAGVQVGKYLDKNDDSFNIGDEVIAACKMDIKKKDGTTYNALNELLSANATRTAHQKQEESATKSSKTGGRISQYLANTQENSISIPAPQKFIPQTSGYNAKGQIKGNSITNGVTLAIARKGKEVTTEDIRNAALEIYELHKLFEDL